MFEILKANNGFIVLEGTYNGERSGYVRKSWVAKDPDDLAELVKQLVVDFTNQSVLERNKDQVGG